MTRLEENELGGTVGVGLTFSPAGVSADATASLVAGYHGGRAWRFPDARSAGAFLDGRDARRRPCRRRARRTCAGTRIGGRAGAEAVAAIADLARAGLTTAAVQRDRAAHGRRPPDADARPRDRRPELSRSTCPAFPPVPVPGARWVADVSWENGAARELALRAATGSGGRLEEYTARLDLREPGNRAVAERLLRPGGTLGDLGALAARLRTDGVVERDGYSVDGAPARVQRRRQARDRPRARASPDHVRAPARRCRRLDPRRPATAAIRLHRRVTVRNLRRTS